MADILINQFKFSYWKLFFLCFIFLLSPFLLQAQDIEIVPIDTIRDFGLNLQIRIVVMSGGRTRQKTVRSGDLTALKIVAYVLDNRKSENPNNFTQFA